MTALFSDWDLDENLDELLARATLQARNQRLYLRDFDSMASHCRETGKPLASDFHEIVPIVRARVSHYTRQVCRIREVINNRENERAQAEKRNKEKASVKMK